MEEKSFKIDGPEESASDDYSLESYPYEGTENVVITDEVVAVIAGQAAMATDYVSSLSPTLAGSIIESFGLKNPTRGVTVRTVDGKVKLDLYVVVKYGTKISDIAWNIQENVKKDVENLTGVTVESVNIHVTGIDFTQRPRRKA